MRLSMLADLALDILTKHPLACAGVAVGAAIMSWVMTRTRGSA